MSVVTWMYPDDCDPPHGLDLGTAHDRVKVEMLAQAFSESGFDRTKSALAGYPLDGRVQLLSGTHRHLAAKLAKVLLPVALYLRRDVEAAHGVLEDWVRIVEDVPVSILEKWTRADVERHRRSR